MTIQNSCLLFLKSQLTTRNLSNKIGSFCADRIISPIVGRQSTNISGRSSCHGFREFSTTPTAMNKTLVDGINLHWEKFGNGPHIVLCLPGLVGSITQEFLAVSKKMNLEKFTLIGVDPPGYGKSRPPDRDVFTEEFALARDARLAGELMKEIGYEKYSILGNSNGGITGALIAANVPTAVHKLVMCNSSLTLNSRTVKILKLMNDLNNWTPAQRKTLLEVYEKAYVVKMISEWRKKIEEKSKCKEFPKYFALEMNKIQAPTLYIRGMRDALSPNKDAEDYGKLIKNFKLHKIAEGGHSHLEFLDEFVVSSESFLSDE